MADDRKRTGRLYVNLAGAARLIQQNLQRDAGAPQLSDLLVDGNYPHAYHYKEPAYTAAWEQQMVEMTGRFLPLPRAVREFPFACSWQMGIFPEIGCVWVTADNVLFLWSYLGGTGSVVRYEGLDQIICSCAIARPLPGAFDVNRSRHMRACSHVLILTTPVEIVVLKVLFSNDSVYGSIQLEPTDLSIPSDNVSMLTVCGTASGRIFMGGQDGNLYELHYRPYGWQDYVPFVSSRCRLVNHSAYRLASLVPSYITNIRFRADQSIISVVVDHHRNILYTLSLRSEVKAFYLGPLGDELTQIPAAVGSDEVQQMLRKHCIDMRGRKGCPAARIFANANWAAKVQVRQMFPLEPTESSLGGGGAEMVAVTRRGIRIYFTTAPPPRQMQRYGDNGYNNNGGSGYYSQSNAVSKKPAKLRVLYVRMPPRSMTQIEAVQSDQMLSASGEITQLPHDANLGPAGRDEYKHSVVNAIVQGDVTLMAVAVVEKADSLLGVVRHPSTLSSTNGTRGRTRMIRNVLGNRRHEDTYANRRTGLQERLCFFPNSQNMGGKVYDIKMRREDSLKEPLNILAHMYSSAGTTSGYGPTVGSKRTLE
eukprot:g2721.t1